MADGSLKFDTKIDTDGFEKGAKTLKERLNGVVSVLRQAGMGVTGAFSNTGAIENANDSVKSLVDEVDRYKEALFYLERQNISFGDAEYDKAYQGLVQAEQALNKYKRELAGTDKEQKKVVKSNKNLNTSLKKTAKTSVPLTKSILKLSNMFRLLVIRMAMRAVIRSVQEGFENLAQYSNQTNKDISALKTSLQTLKNSFASAFAPILQTVVPVLQVLIGYLSQAISAMGQFFAVLLTGATTFTKAKDAQVDYAKSLKDTAKAANKSLSPIDKLNTVADTDAGGGASKGPSPTEMFEEVEIDDGVIRFADKIKGAIAEIKKSLEELIGYLVGTFKPTFSQVWEDLQGPIEKFKGIMAGIGLDISTLLDPMSSYVSETFIPTMQGHILNIGAILAGLFDSFNTIFSDIWNLAVFPRLEKLTTVALPMVTEFGGKVGETLGVLFDEVKKTFDMIWEEGMAPALELATEIWNGFIDTLSEFWEDWGEPIFEGIKEAIKTTGELFRDVWREFLKPIWDKIMEVVDRVWTDHLKPLLANILDFVGELVTGALEIYNKFIAPIVKWFVKTFGPPIAKVINFLIDNIGDFLGNILDTASHIIDALKGLVNFIVGVFTGDWKRAWNGIKEIFKGVFNALVNIVKTPINIIIGIINGMISGIVAGVNTVIKAINSISFTIPNWVPGIGGKGIGFNLKTLTAPKIPKLATGTVVPANYGEFMAILGDNTREAEVVSPLSTMKQAFKEALAENGGGNSNINLSVYLDGKQIHSEIVKQDKQYKDQTGKSAFAY